MSLEGKVACVTGASGGLGEAIAVALVKNGACVALGARRLDQLERVKLSLEDLVGPGKVVIHRTDVTAREDMKALVRAAEAAFGPLDIFVNNAGVMHYTTMKNLHEDEWEQMVDVNCKGVLNGIGASLEVMVPRGSGHIVNISSDASKRVFPSLAVYCGTKTFVDVVCEGSRRELVGSGIRITVIQPGDAATDLVVNNTDTEAAAALGVTIGQKISGEKTKILDPSDVADAVIYATTAPAHVAINEILVEPRDQE
jgi:NADP-dependent 3-hydroxy acid dehydrogenase YdfG